MKKVIWAIVLLIAPVAICVLSLFYVMKVSNESREYVEILQNSVKNSEFEKAKTEIDNFEDYWEDQYELLSIIINHNIIQEIDESIFLLKASIKDISEDEKVDFELESARAILRIRNLYEMELPSVYNIF